MTEYLAHFGYAGLMSFSFLAATILPFNSEAVLATALALKMPPWPALLFATIGNCAGVWRINFWLFTAAAFTLRFSRYLLIVGFFQANLGRIFCGMFHDITQPHYYKE